MNKDDLVFLASFLNEGLIIDKYLDPYEIEEEKEAISKVEEAEEAFVSDILFKGSNSSKVAVCVQYSDEEWISVKDRLFLDKILVAVGLSLESIALINLHNTQKKNISQVGEKLPENKIIAFGLSSSLVQDFPKNKITHKNGQDYLCVDWSLTDIAMSKEKKNVLWKNLKSLFEL
ncbi:MAG: hypothetical protein ISR55_01280 [Bacteroidetes bacterium]|nr:hypothetical protein [Bacteroidota bacterium]MBL6962431.1 hypothetical protein [Bacteroidota bacterium]